jgi:hypothetical protein
MRRLQAAVLRTSGGPLRPLWRGCYTLAAWAVALCLRGLRPGTTVYLGGSLGFGEPVYGLSDVDVIAVTAGDPEPVRRRWRRTAAAIPPLARVAADTFVYGEQELLRAAAAPCQASPETFLRRDGFHDEAGLTVRPGPFGATREWRRLAGRERRPSGHADDGQARRLAAWLELQFWWRFAFRAALRPREPETAFLCVKLIAEPARLWLWLTENRAVFARREVLRAAGGALTQEREAFQLALELEQRLPERPRPPLAAALASLTRQSQALAALMDDAASSAGHESVRLTGAGPSPFALLDWRALVAPAAPARFVIAAGAPADTSALARAAQAQDDPATALRSDGLLVRPTAASASAKLRAVQCAATDPVSFALAGGAAEARFPGLPGWSISSWAQRAVAEHRIWMRAPARATLNGHAWLGAPAAKARLIGAARAALLQASIAAGEPELLLSDDLVAERLGAHVDEPAALRQAVERLEAYR